MKHYAHPTPHHYPFGSIVESRSWKGDYRYGFNGQEGEDEVSGKGNCYAFTYRIQDTRLGRFLSVDPLYKEFAWNSSFAFAENQVIWAKDLEGAETFVSIYKRNNGRSHMMRLTNDGNLGSGMLNVVVSSSGVDAVSYQAAVVTGGTDVESSQSGMSLKNVDPRIMDALIKHRASPIELKTSLMQFKVNEAMSEFGGEFGLTLGELFLGVTSIGSSKAAQALYSFGRQTMLKLNESTSLTEAVSKVNLIEVGLDALPMSGKGFSLSTMAKEFGLNLGDQAFKLTLEKGFEIEDMLPAALNAGLGTAANMKTSFINKQMKAANLNFIGKKNQLFTDVATDLGQNAISNELQTEASDKN